LREGREGRGVGEGGKKVKGGRVLKRERQNVFGKSREKRGPVFLKWILREGDGEEERGQHNTYIYVTIFIF